MALSDTEESHPGELASSADRKTDAKACAEDQDQPSVEPISETPKSLPRKRKAGKAVYRLEQEEIKVETPELAFSEVIKTDRKRIAKASQK